MKWIPDGLGGGHNGQYYYKCSICKQEDWFANYTDPNKENCKCPHCGATPKEKK